MWRKGPSFITRTIQVGQKTKRYTSMYAREYSLRLGVISPEQFQAALDRFELGTLIKKERTVLDHYC